MGISITRTGFRSLDSLVFKLHQDLLQAGFELTRIRSYGERTPSTQLINPSPVGEEPLEGNTAQYLFKATGKIDILATLEPWYLLIEVHPNFLRTYALTEASFGYDRNGNLEVYEVPEHSRTENQVNGVGSIEYSYPFGHMSKNNLIDAKDPYRFFLNIIPGESTWHGYEGVSVDSEGYRVCSGAPLAYSLTVSSYGIVFYCYSPVMNTSGNCHSWFCIQRLVNKEGKVDYTKGFNPVWCVFSQNGGGEVYLPFSDSPTSIDGSETIYDFDQNGISQFCVRERDIYYPTPVVSAITSSSIGCPVLENRQSVAHTEDRKWQVEIPTGFSTWRHKYSLFMDLIGMTSADVAAHASVVKRVLFSDGYNRSYTGMQANFKNNKGRRLFILTDGPGTSATENLALIPFASNTNIDYTGTSDKLSKLFNLELQNIFGARVSSDRLILVPYIIDPASTAIEGKHYSISDNVGYAIFEAEDTKTGIYGKLMPNVGDSVNLILKVDTSGINPEYPEIIYTININWG